MFLPLMIIRASLRLQPGRGRTSAHEPRMTPERAVDQYRLMALMITNSFKVR